MADTLPRHEPTLTEFIADRARSASDTRLALNAGLGLGIAAAVGFGRPAGWVALMSLALAFAAYGLWGIADRELAERGHDRRSFRPWKVVRALAAVLGALGGLGFVAAVLGVVLGKIIS